jgi:hypothetical protein
MRLQRSFVPVCNPWNVWAALSAALETSDVLAAGGIILRNNPAKDAAQERHSCWRGRHQGREKARVKEEY